MSAGPATPGSTAAPGTPRRRWSTPSGRLVATAVVRTAADVAGRGRARLTTSCCAAACVDRSGRRGGLGDRVRAARGRSSPRARAPSSTRTRAVRSASSRARSPSSTSAARTPRSSSSTAAGRRVAHKMNRKCAAGTGSFLEEIALRLDVRHRRPAGAGRAVRPRSCELGSFCTVFTGTEVLDAHPRGQAPRGPRARRLPLGGEAGRSRWSASRGRSWRRAAWSPTTRWWCELLEKAIGQPVTVPEHPQEIGALGVAIAAPRGGGRHRQHGKGGQHEPRC